MAPFRSVRNVWMNNPTVTASEVRTTVTCHRLRGQQMLPDGDGLELLARMRAAKVDTPVIMMSGHATIDTAVKATRLGALNFLEKPINTDALLIGVETALRLDRAEAEAKALRLISGSGTDLVGDSPPIKHLVAQIAVSYTHLTLPTSDLV